MDITREYIYQNLQKQFYVNVPFIMERSQITDAVEAFFKFLEEPMEVKSHIDFTIAPEHRRGDVGFKHRNPEEDIYNDSKDFFHFHPALFDKYPDFVKAHPSLHDFANKAQPIWDLAYKTVMDVLSTFEEEFPRICSKVFDTKYPHVLLRFLKYN